MPDKTIAKEAAPRPPIKTVKIPGVTHRIIMLTPELAQWWLDNANAENRIEWSLWVNYLSRQMDEGMWLFNGDTIVLDTNNDVVDGQHRFEMCVKTGQSFPVLLVEGVAPKSRLTVDDNRVRKFADDLMMNGSDSAGAQEDLLRKIIRWRTVGGFVSKVERIGRMELAAEHPAYEKEMLGAIEACHHFSRIPVSPRVRAFMWWLLTQSAPESDVRKYFSVLAIGSLHPEDHVLITLQDKLTKLKESRGNRKEPKTAASIYYMITGWNAWVTQRRTNYPLPQGGLSDPYPVPVPVERSAA